MTRGINSFFTRHLIYQLSFIRFDFLTLNDIIPALIKLDYVKSKSEFLRLLNQDGVKIEGEKVAADDLNRVLIHGDIMKIGKKRFLRFIK